MQEEEFVIVEKLDSKQDEKYEFDVFMESIIKKKEEKDDEKIDLSEIYRQINNLKVLGFYDETCFTNAFLQKCLHSKKKLDDFVDQKIFKEKYRNILKRLIREPSQKYTTIKDTFEEQKIKENARRMHVYSCYEHVIELRKDQKFESNFKSCGPGTTGFYDFRSGQINYLCDFHIEEAWKPEFASLFLDESVQQDQLFERFGAMLQGKDLFSSHRENNAKDEKTITIDKTPPKDKDKEKSKHDEYLKLWLSQPSGLCRG